MPGRPDKDADHHLRMLDASWAGTRQHWDDDMTRRFEADHWRRLDSEYRSYLTALRKLMDLIAAAERDTEY